MTAATHNMTIEKGASLKKTITWKDSNSSAISLAPYGARMQFRETIEHFTPVLSVDTTTSAIVLEPNASTGVIQIDIDASVTASFTFDTGVYDLELYVSANPVDVTRLMEGSLTVIPEVTRNYATP